MTKTEPEKMTYPQLRRWAKQQRIHNRNGKLSPEQIAKLEEIPGWTWDEPEKDQEARGD